jgi:hypothetical protein
VQEARVELYEALLRGLVSMRASISVSGLYGRRMGMKIGVLGVFGGLHMGRRSVGRRSVGRRSVGLISSVHSFSPLYRRATLFEMESE